VNVFCTKARALFELEPNARRPSCAIATPVAPSPVSTAAVTDFDARSKESTSLGGRQADDRRLSVGSNFPRVWSCAYGDTFTSATLAASPDADFLELRAASIPYTQRLR
jgi:hypothetical protein